jgi:hypothetical protein
VRLLTHHRRPHSRWTGAGREDAGPVPTVLPVESGARLARRLGELRARAGTFDLAPAAGFAVDGDVPGISQGVEVAAITVTDDDARGVATVRTLRRAHDGLRLVVVGHGIDWFEDAFDFGADAWVDHTADDETLLSAIHGPRRRGAHRHLLSRGG